MLPIDECDMSKAKKVKDYIVSHSETGHHHVIAGDSLVLEREGKDTIVAIEEDTELVHKKSFDRHENLPLKEGIFRVLKKQEYDPFGEVMREVWD